MGVRITAIKIHGERIPVDSITGIEVQAAPRYQKSGDNPWVFPDRIEYSDVRSGPEIRILTLKDGTTRRIEVYS